MKPLIESAVTFTNTEHFRGRGAYPTDRLSRVSSDLLPDLLSGLVAGGTLALAGATVYLGRASARVAVDAVSPRVFVSRLNVEPQPVNWPNVAGAEPQSINPGLAWSLAQHGADRLGQQASARLRNESGVSALVRPEPPGRRRDLGIGWTNPQMPVTPSRQGEWYVVGPGREMVFTMYWWRPASAWAESLENRDAGLPASGNSRHQRPGSDRRGYRLLQDLLRRVCARTPPARGRLGHRGPG